MTKAEIGILGGSGFYAFLEKSKEIEVKTPYGRPSSKVAMGEIAGRKVAFLPRHGKKHQYPPHMIPYRANIYALKKLGVKRILAPATVGSLQGEIKPGDFVICDQFVDRTRGRKDTFYDGPRTTHISSADPYCPELRKLAIESARELNIPVHEKGTVVVIQGPRFSTKAESKWFTDMGWHVIVMTQYPEVVLARELEICYLNISLVTDYDVGLVVGGEVEPVSAEEVLRVFRANNEQVKKLLFRLIEKIPDSRTCLCKEALEEAVISG